MTVKCTYCQKLARLVDGTELYPHRKDLARVKAWVCACGARVGCHDGTETPKGTFARPERIKARQAAHRMFDPLWQNFREAYPGALQAPIGKLRRCARERAYWWLSHEMGSPNKQLHIGEMDEEQCARVVFIIREKRPTAASIRTWAKARKQ